MDETNCIASCKTKTNKNNGKTNKNNAKDKTKNYTSCACYWDNDEYRIRTIVGIGFILLGLFKLLYFSLCLWTASHLDESPAWLLMLTGGDDSRNGYITSALFIFIGLVSLFHGIGLTWGEYSENSEGMLYRLRRLFEGFYVEVLLFGLIGLFMTAYYVSISPYFKNNKFYEDKKKDVALTETFWDRAFINVNILFGAMFIAWALFSTLAYHEFDALIWTLIGLLGVWSLSVGYLIGRDFVRSR